MTKCDRALLRRDGRPVAAVMPAADLELLTALEQDEAAAQGEQVHRGA